MQTQRSARSEMEDMKSRISNIEEKIDDIAGNVAKITDLLIGDGTELSLAAKVHILWKTTITVVTILVGLVVERVYHLFTGKI